MVHCGIEKAEDVERYDWDNRSRSGFCLLQYTISGEGRFKAGSDSVASPLPPGSAFLISAPGDTRYWLPEGGKWRLGYALFSGLAAFHHCNSVIASRGMVLHLEKATGVLRALCAINAYGETGGYYAASSRLYELLMQLRQWAGGGSGQEAGLLAPALELIEREYTNSQLGVDELAAACGYSRFHFARLFRAGTGDSPQAYLIKSRLRHALRLLGEGRVPPKQVALLCGFNDYSYFCQIFRRHYGITPGNARRSASHP